MFCLVKALKAPNSKKSLLVDSSTWRNDIWKKQMSQAFAFQEK